MQLVSADDVIQLQDRLVAFVRAFGLLAGADRTPCGTALPLSQAHALIELERGPTTQRELTRTLQLERSSVSRLVDKLQSNGWVSTEPEDVGRGVLLRLTDAGCRVARDLAEARARRFAALLDTIPPDRHQQVREALDLLTAASHRLENPHEDP